MEITVIELCGEEAVFTSRDASVRARSRNAGRGCDCRMPYLYSPSTITGKDMLVACRMIGSSVNSKCQGREPVRVEDHFKSSGSITSNSSAMIGLILTVSFYAESVTCRTISSKACPGAWNAQFVSDRLRNQRSQRDSPFGGSRHGTTEQRFGDFESCLACPDFAYFMGEGPRPCKWPA